MSIPDRRLDLRGDRSILDEGGLTMGIWILIISGTVMLILGLIANSGVKRKPECTCPRHGVGGH